VNLSVDATSQSFGTIDIVVAANTFQSVAATTPPVFANDGVFFPNNYRLDIQNVNFGSGFRAVTGIGLSLARNGTTVYTPGPLSLHTIRVGALLGGNAPAATRADLDTWAAQVAAGQTALRTGTLRLLANDLTVIASIDFTGLEPVTFLSPLPIGGADWIDLRVGGVFFGP
jgi:hypothetical protein